MQNLLYNLFSAAGGGASLDWQLWSTAQEDHAASVALYRNYARGNHPARLTADMRQMLRLPATASSSPAAINYMQSAISAICDRLTLLRVDADTTDASLWASQIYRLNRLDGVQFALHESAVRDGDAYVMVSVSSQRQPIMTIEPSFDGQHGVVMVSNSDGTDIAACKIWPEGLSNTSGRPNWTYRANIYYDDHIEYWRGTSGGWSKIEEDGKWQDRFGNPLGIPLIRFSYNRLQGDTWGQSKIAPLLTAQDMLNATVLSMVATAEQTAFPVRFSVGFKPDGNLAPGTIISIGPTSDTSGVIRPPDEKTVAWYNAIRMGEFKQGDILPFVQQSQFLIDQIHAIARIPDPSQASGNASGEALKEWQAALIAQINRAQVDFGQAWENVFRLSASVQSAFANSQPPAASEWIARWQAAEPRSDALTVANAKAIADHVDQRTLLQALAPAFGWSSEQIETIISARSDELGALMRNVTNDPR